MNRSKYSEAEKSEILSKIDAKDESISKMCERFNISVPTYYAWKKDIKKENKDKYKANVNNQILIETCLKVLENNSQILSIVHNIQYQKKM